MVRFQNTDLVAASMTSNVQILMQDEFQWNFPLFAAKCSNYVHARLAVLLPLHA